MYKIICGLLLVLAFSSCEENERNEDVVQQPNKDGSIETILSVAHADSFDILTTTHKVWVKGTLSKTIVKTDTLSALGMVNEEVEDKDGHTETKSVKKDYEFFITVK
jgi:hypothetical protein